MVAECIGLLDAPQAQIGSVSYDMVLDYDTVREVLLILCGFRLCNLFSFLFSWALLENKLAYTLAFPSTCKLTVIVL